MERKLIKADKEPTDTVSDKEIKGLLEEHEEWKRKNDRRWKSKIDFINGSNLVKFEKTEELGKPLFKTSLTETEIVKALRLTIGNHSQVDKILWVSQSAISQRISRSKRLQEVIRMPRQKYIDIVENIVLQRLKEMDFEASRLGEWQRITQKQEEKLLKGIDYDRENGFN